MSGRNAVHKDKGGVGKGDIKNKGGGEMEKWRYEDIERMRRGKGVNREGENEKGWVGWR